MLSRTPGSSSMMRIRDIGSNLAPSRADKRGMNYLWWLVAASSVAASGACADIRPEPIGVPPGHVPAVVRIKAADGGRITRVPLEEYVRGTILSEFAPPSGDPAVIERMLEVQAVIARTYAVAHLGRHQREGYDLCSTTHCQLYQPGRLKTSTWAPLAVDAGKRTSGLILWHSSAPARALFHADCGGHTSAAEDIWGGTARPYLMGSSDDGAAAGAHTAWRYEIERGKLTAALNRDPLTRVGKQLIKISVRRRDEGGRALLVVLSGTRAPVVRGEELRAVLVRAFGVSAIKSTRFTISRSGDRFIFTGRGFGHGVGLCQAGA